MPTNKKKSSQIFYLKKFFFPVFFINKDQLVRKKNKILVKNYNL